MATRQPTTGLAHLTVVPENFEAEGATDEGTDEVVESTDTEG